MAGNFDLCVLYQLVHKLERNSITLQIKCKSNFIVEWNPVSKATNGTPKVDRINAVVVITRLGQMLEFTG